MRIVDVLASGIGLILLSPLFLVIALAIKSLSPGPAFYRATRAGKDAVPFQLYKFRSMVSGADKLGPGITTAEDHRITRIGRFLRKTKLDELPQLINVFKGDMSLVGPRPEDPRYISYYTSEQRGVFRVRPGITSPASLRYRDESFLLTGQDWECVYVKQIMPHKLAIELDYLADRSLFTDLGLLAQTVWTVVTHL
jgi:lipopolysaccharide/colanic/teichoic acid biosynthesis glycosyltransferase